MSVKEEAKLRWKDKPLSEREEKVKSHLEKYSGLEGHMVVLLNPGAKSVNFKGLEERLFSVKQETLIAQLIQMLQSKTKIPGSFFLVVGKKYLNPKSSLKDLAKKFPNKNDFVMIEYQDVEPF